MVYYYFFFLFGIIICQKVSNYLPIHDSSFIVLDEFVGMLIPLMALKKIDFFWVFIVFLFFRFFDIIKPWPISLCDKKIKNGFGIMFDDVLAGFFSFLVVCILNRFIF